MIVLNSAEALTTCYHLLALIKEMSGFWTCLWRRPAGEWQYWRSHHYISDLNTVVAALEASRDQKGRIEEEIKAAPSGISRKEWRAELNKILMQEKALQEEMGTLTQRLRDESADADLRQQIKAALGNAGEFVQSLSKEARDQFLRATIRKMVVNVPQTESVKNGAEVLTFQPPIEKGRYLVNVEFRESSLASMLSKHYAEHSINIDSWLPGKGSNLRPSD